MRKLILLLALFATFAAPAVALAQGFYQNTLRRNPYTGRWEVVPNPAVQSSQFGPYRNQRQFSGESYNPYDGTFSGSTVQRNPFTGRLDVQNYYYNPYTGARVIEGTRFNPLTGRYETVNSVQPPTNPIPSGEALPPPPSEEPDPAAPTTARKPITGPRIIENQFPSNPPPK
jgi:hypothetical protein